VQCAPLSRVEFPGPSAPWARGAIILT
jgi:hypothetical protein